MVTRTHRGRRIFLVAAVLLATCLPLDTSFEYLDPGAEGSANAPPGPAGVEGRETIVEVRSSLPYNDDLAVTPILTFGPRFRPPDQLDGPPQKTSSVEIWFLWFFPWWGSPDQRESSTRMEVNHEETNR